MTTTANTARVAELAAREKADVVVLDASELPAGAISAAVTRVEGLVPPAGVVLVAEEVSSHGPDAGVLLKWGPFQELVQAIERVDAERTAARASGARKDSRP